MFLASPSARVTKGDVFLASPSARVTEGDVFLAHPSARATKEERFLASPNARVTEGLPIRETNLREPENKPRAQANNLREVAKEGVEDWTDPGAEL